MASGQKPFEHIRLATGAADQKPRRINATSFQPHTTHGERPVNLVKLHGSATWKRETLEPGSPIIDAGMRVPTGS